MNIRYLIITFIILTLGVIAWKAGDRKVQSPQVVKHTLKKVEAKEADKKRIQIDSPHDQEQDFKFISPNELIREITNTELSVLERTVKILNLRKISLNKADEIIILNHLKRIDPKESASIRNDLIEHSVRYIADKKTVGDTLLSILENSKHDRVTREYVLQYIPEFYISRWSPELNWSDSEENDRQKMNDVLWGMTELTEGSMAGGALFALFRVSDKYSDIKIQNVFARSREILINPAYMNPNRMGAVQILAFSDNEEYFQTAKQIVYSEDQPTLLRVTAMHTASKSKFPDKEFVIKLTELSQSKNKVHPSLRKCAELTLSKLNN